MRHSVWMQAEEWKDVQRAAARQQLQTGDRTTAAEFIRQAIREKIERQESATK